MRLWQRFTNVIISKVLRLGDGAKIVIESSGNAAPIEIGLPELRKLDVGSRVVAGGSAITLTKDDHDGKTILLDTAAGTTVTLPAATGSGARFRLVVSVTATSNQHRVNVTGDDAFYGQAILAQDGGDTVVMFEAGADADRINLNGTTTGGIKGAVIELEDIAADTWAAQIRGSATGTEATPFLTGQVS